MSESKPKKQFTAIAMRWRDKVNGNTYHSVRIIRHSDGTTLYCPFQYGYGEHYRQTGLTALSENGWIPADEKDAYRWERENDYPIIWEVSDGLKRDCVANGKQ